MKMERASLTWLEAAGLDTHTHTHTLTYGKSGLLGTTQ